MSKASLSFSCRIFCPCQLSPPLPSTGVRKGHSLFCPFAWTKMLCTERVGLPTSGVCPPLWQFLPRSDEKSADTVCFVPCAMPSRFSRVRLFVTPWTAAHQAPLSLGFSRHEYCSGLPCPSPGDLPDPGIKPTSPVSPALAGGFFTTEPPGKLLFCALRSK